MNPVDIFKPRFVWYRPEEVRMIRRILGESPAEFAERFHVSEDAVKAWETPAGQAKHREVSGPAARLMYWCAVEANSRVSCRNRKIRLAAAGSLHAAG